MSDGSDSEDEILYETDIPMVIKEMSYIGDDSDSDDEIYYKMDLPKMINDRSYELTGLSLEELIDDIVKDLKVMPGSCKKEINEILDICNKDDIGKIAYMIGKYFEKGIEENQGKFLRFGDFELLVGRVASEIYFSTIKNMNTLGYRGLAARVLTELPKRLELY